MRRQEINKIFDQHFDRLYSYVAFRVAPDRQAAEDITQEVFLAALQGLDSYRGNGSSWTWFVSIARHKIADHFRSASKRSYIPPDAASPAVFLENEQQERALLVSLAFRRLPENYSGVLESKYIDGLSVAKIARRKGSTESAIESLLSRARQAFEHAYRTVEKTGEG